MIGDIILYTPGANNFWELPISWLDPMPAYHKPEVFPELWLFIFSTLEISTFVYCRVILYWRSDVHCNSKIQT